jgi:hypothetical protein
MTEQKIEVFWRDATAGDVVKVMKGEKVEARFRDPSAGWGDWVWCAVDNSTLFLAGWKDGEWFDHEGDDWNQCQVYEPQQWWLDKPDPGEGWRLLDPFNEKNLEKLDEFFCTATKTWRQSANAMLGKDQQPETWYRRRIEPVNNLEIPNESSELVAIAMQMACEEFGRGDGTFNSANFEHACRQIVGSSCSIDGHVIAFILDGRQDVEALKGGRHYRYLKYASRSYSTQEQQSKSSKAPHGSRSLENIPTGWRLLNDNEDRIASDAFWSIGAKDWVIIDECRVESANRDKWPAIRQVEHCRCMMLMEGCFYRLPGGQGIKVTKQGFELE